MVKVSASTRHRFGRAFKPFVFALVLAFFVPAAAVSRADEGSLNGEIPIYFSSQGFSSAPAAQFEAYVDGSSVGMLTLNPTVTQEGGRLKGTFDVSGLRIPEGKLAVTPGGSVDVRISLAGDRLLVGGFESRMYCDSDLGFFPVASSVSSCGTPGRGIVVSKGIVINYVFDAVVVDTDGDGRADTVSSAYYDGNVLGAFNRHVDPVNFLLNITAFGMSLESNSVTVVDGPELVRGKVFNGRSIPLYPGSYTITVSGVQGVQDKTIVFVSDGVLAYGDDLDSNGGIALVCNGGNEVEFQDVCADVRLLSSIPLVKEYRGSGSAEEEFSFSDDHIGIEDSVSLEPGQTKRIENVIPEEYYERVVESIPTVLGFLSDPSIPFYEWIPDGASWVKADGTSAENREEAQYGLVYSSKNKQTVRYQAQPSRVVFDTKKVAKGTEEWADIVLTRLGVNDVENYGVITPQMEEDMALVDASAVFAKYTSIDCLNGRPVASLDDLKECYVRIGVPREYLSTPARIYSFENFVGTTYQYEVLGFFEKLHRAHGGDNADFKIAVATEETMGAIGDLHILRGISYDNPLSSATDSLYFVNGQARDENITGTVATVTKEARGELTLQGDDFEFELCEDAECAAVLETAKNTADGSVPFTKLTINTLDFDDGTYTWYVREKVPAVDSDIKYDVANPNGRGAVQKITFTVSTEETGGEHSRKAKIESKNEITFVNEKSAPSNPFVLKKSSLNDDGTPSGQLLADAKFEMTTTVGGATKYVDASGNLVDTKTQVDLGEITLDTKVLPAGNYTLTEMEAPQRYKKADEPWIMTINDDESMSVKHSSYQGVSSNQPGAVCRTEADSDTWTCDQTSSGQAREVPLYNLPDNPPPPATGVMTSSSASLAAMVGAIAGLFVALTVVKLRYRRR